MGIPHVVDYREVDFADALREIHPDGVDVVEDFIGPAYLARHVSLLRWRGRLAFVGLLSSGSCRRRRSAPQDAAASRFTLRPDSVAEKAAVVERFRRRWLPELNDRRITPAVHAVLPFGQTAEAHRMLENADNFGKIVLRI